MTKAELSILLTGDSETRVLNRQYRGVDATTDVLSFPLVEQLPVPDDYSGPLGDIVISLDTAKRQSADDFSKERLAVAADWSYLDEVTFLLVHGLLHLLGHDHHEASETVEMESEERRLFELIARGDE